MSSGNGESDLPSLTEENPLKEAKTKFYSRAQDCLELPAPVETVAKYLNAHAAWFTRCAEPMKVQQLTVDSYVLVIGRFGAFGYEVEPKIALELLPPELNTYRIRTISVPNHQPPGYDVDYRSSTRLNAVSTDLGEITQMEWELDLTVEVYFPKFIQRLPQSLVQTTGDRLLQKIVRQISHRLTRKVQEDFHQSLPNL